MSALVQYDQGPAIFPAVPGPMWLTGVDTAGTRDLAAREPRLGLLAVPGNRTVNSTDAYSLWAADNGCFAETPAKPFDQERWLAWLGENTPKLNTCLFATLPDVVGDAAATLRRSMPLADPVRRLGYPVALVGQDGLNVPDVPWDDIDAMFIGGSTDWKLSAAAAQLVDAARERGKWTHVGRVNSLKRLRYCAAIGADSADGTYIKFGPTENVRRVEGWFRQLDD